MKPTEQETAKIISEMAFVIETVAHMRGLERELLPLADKARELVERIESCES